ncbi:2-polyprenylphenol 6-hydroxylase [bacterium]|nr:2-polyprenylphenol 6-hydroxylase [bacterium]
MIKYGLTEKLTRYRQIGNVIVKYGFGIILEKTHLIKILKIPFRKKKKEDFSPPVRVRKMLEELGPTFIKLGQILSTRPDLIPIPYLKELEKLQDMTNPSPFEEIKKVVEGKTGKKIEELFDEFEEVPFASASISQVHRAKIEGKTVAVKIQKPGVEKEIFLDLQILYDIAELIERFIKEAEIYQPVRIVEEFEKSIKKELNFLIEARNIERFRNNFRDEKDVFIPHIYHEFTNEKMLTLEFVDGIKISRIEEVEKAGFDRKEIAEKISNIVLKQVFIDGFFHADPHPGNIFVLKDGRICLLDFGIIGRLNEERKLQLIYLFNGLIKGDSERIIRTLKEMNAIEEDEVNIEDLEREIDDMLDRYRDLPLKEINLNEILGESFEIMRKFKIKIPADLSLLSKVLLTLEGVMLNLNPEFKIITSLKPYVIEFIEKRARFFSFNELIKNFQEFYYMAKQIPSSVESFLKLIKKGYVNVAFEHKGLQNLTSTMDKSSNRISFSLIISAILISSSLIMVSGKGPHLMGLPAFGIIGFLVSGILGIWLIVGIIKSGRV